MRLVRLQHPRSQTKKEYVMKKYKESNGLLITLLLILAIVFIVLFTCVHADAMPVLYTDTINELAQEIGGQYAL